MPGDVFFDTWAWWEILGRGPSSRHLARKYLRPDVRIHISILSLADISGRLAAKGQEARSRSVLSRIEGRSKVHAVPLDVAERSGQLRAQLRKADPSASTIDALILGTARHLGFTLISGDQAFEGQSDVRSS